MSEFDILNLNDVICEVIKTETLLSPKYSMIKTINWSNINKKLLHELLENKYKFINFAKICYNKYKNILNINIYDPIHYDYKFWIKYILKSINMHIKNDFICINHSCCTENCITLNEMLNIILFELQRKKL